jgi:hypothetical protein
VHGELSVAVHDLDFLMLGTYVLLGIFRNLGRPGTNPPKRGYKSFNYGTYVHFLLGSNFVNLES